MQKATQMEALYPIVAQTPFISDFEKNNPDLNTEGRRDYVNDLTVTIRKENPSWGPKQIISEAVTQARGNLDLPVPTAVKPDPALDLASKKNRKT